MVREHIREHIDWQIDESILQAIWMVHYEERLDELGHSSKAVARMKDDVVSGDWLAVLEVVESFVNQLDHPKTRTIRTQALDLFNLAFVRYLVGFRFVGTELVSVTDKEEIEQIAGALEATSGTTSRTHLDRALALLADKREPIYAKVISEAVGAVESEVRLLTGKNDLADGLKQLEAKGYAIHPALRGAWTKLYGYTSDAGGIRHALIRDDEVDEALAVYFLVSCSAFINLLRKVSASDRT
ncbi:hypothetical protein GCM10022287_23840 [Gryllotalpicola koreensis]|uniref:DUF4145 domain-containing protein n=2 Tax=Gryllotalpicola koreensis TaxID=993086 RepID=A0ABP8A2V3_9MICO